MPGEASAAGDHGGFGRAVGVPDLAGWGGEAFGEFGWAGLAAHDQQADAGESVDRPQRDEGRDGRDDGDVIGDEPRAEVDAAADEGAGGGHETRAVTPSQPHLLAGGVEGHGEASHDPIAHTDRIVLQEHS